MITSECSNALNFSKFRESIIHSVEKREIFSHQRNISSNQLFHNLLVKPLLCIDEIFAKNIREWERIFVISTLCHRIWNFVKLTDKICIVWRLQCNVATRSAHQLFLGVTAPQMVSDLYEMIISICRITFSLILQNFMQFGGFWIFATKYIIFGHFDMSGKLVLR